jgi:8-oxo-dGTP pyrophosphatase MutT (NUDIX family)
MFVSNIKSFIRVAQQRTNTPYRSIASKSGVAASTVKNAVSNEAPRYPTGVPELIRVFDALGGNYMQMIDLIDARVDQYDGIIENINREVGEYIGGKILGIYRLDNTPSPKCTDPSLNADSPLLGVDYNIRDSWLAPTLDNAYEMALAKTRGAHPSYPGKRWNEITAAISPSVTAWPPELLYTPIDWAMRQSRRPNGGPGLLTLATGGLVIDRTSILLQHRGKAVESSKDLYSVFSGGFRVASDEIHAGHDDSLIDGARREIEEETGLSAANLDFTGSMAVLVRDNQHYLNMIYIGVVADDRETSFMFPDVMFGKTPRRQIEKGLVGIDPTNFGNADANLEGPVVRISFTDIVKLVQNTPKKMAACGLMAICTWFAIGAPNAPIAIRLQGEYLARDLMNIYSGVETPRGDAKT